MRRLLGAELLKLRTTRTFVGFVAAALVLSLLVAVLIAAIADGVTEEDARSIITFDTTSIFVLLLGTIGMTGEWRHRTITSSVLAAPDRTRLLIAKALAYAAAGAVLSLLITVTLTVVTSVILSSRGEETVAVADALDVLWRNLVIAAFFGAIGVAIGAIVRNQVAAVIVLIVLAFVIEPALLGLAPDVERFLPLGGAANAVLDSSFDGEPASEDLLSPGLGVLVLLAWTAALSATGVALLRGRDLT